MKREGWVAKTARVAWWFSVLWLSNALLSLSYEFAGILITEEGERWETRLVAWLTLLVSTPALLCALAIGLIPRTGLSHLMRAAAILLALACVTVYLALSHVGRHYLFFPNY